MAQTLFRAYGCKAKSSTLSVLVIALAMATSSSQTSAADPSTTVKIPELGASIVVSSEGLVVADITPAPARSEKYRGIDMKIGDIIVSFNGQKVSTIAKLQRLLSEVRVGDEVRLGALRSSTPVVAVYTVADAGVPQSGCSTTKQPPAKGGGASSGGGCQPMVLKLNAGEGEAPCLGLGAVFKDVDGRVTVSQVMPLLSSSVPVCKLVEGDIIKSIKSHKVTRAADFVELYDAFKTGDSIELLVDRKGKETRFAFSKPKTSAPTFYQTN